MNWNSRLFDTTNYNLIILQSDAYIAVYKRLNVDDMLNRAHSCPCTDQIDVNTATRGSEPDDFYAIDARYNDVQYNTVMYTTGEWHR